jgi:hypothetical protein
MNKNELYKKYNEIISVYTSNKIKSDDKVKFMEEVYQIFHSSRYATLLEYIMFENTSTEFINRWYDKAHKLSRKFKLEKLKGYIL